MRGSGIIFPGGGPRLAFLTLAAFLLCLPMSGQTSTSAREMTSPSMPSSPSMPTVSAPAIGNGFYVPGSEGFYTGQKNVPSAKPQAPESVDSSVTQDTKAQEIASSKAAAPSYSIASEINSALTASDLSALDGLGLTPSLSSLLGGSSLSALNSKTQSTGSDTILLQRILSELDEIKKSVNSDSKAGTNKALTAQSTSINASETLSKSGQQILRFTINKSDMLGFVRSVYFSKPESDGTFLLTGDAKYAANGKFRTETFYLLFHADGTKNAGTSYTVTPSLSQSTQDESTFLYRFTHSHDLKAFKTGNLVTLRSQENGVSADLLISLE